MYDFYEIIIVLVLMATVTVISASYLLNKQSSQVPQPLVSISLPKPVQNTRQTLPADLRPFKDLVYGIHKNYLNSITNNYNKLILTVFSVLNKTQIKSITTQNLPVIQTEIMVNQEITSLMQQMKSEYPMDIGQTLLKHFLKASIFQLLDNFYTGPNINYPNVPTPIGNIDFVYTSKRLRSSFKPSQIYPFLVIAPNIPRDKLLELTNLYDSIVIKYMTLLNNTVSSLPELNEQTIKTINISQIQITYAKDIQADFIRIQRILSEDTPLVIRKAVYSNILPLLDQFYKGPPINLKTVVPIVGAEYKLRFRYPNRNRKLIFTLKKLPPVVCPSGTFIGPNGLCQCPPGQGLVKGRCQPYCPKGSYFAGTVTSFGVVMASCNVQPQYIPIRTVGGRKVEGTGIFVQKPSILIPTVPIIQPKKPVDTDTD